MAVLENTIYVGSITSPLYSFTNKDIILNTAKGVFSVDTIDNELAIDTFTVSVRYDPHGSSALVYAPISSDGYLTAEGLLYGLWMPNQKDFMQELLYGTPVWWYCGGVFFAKGYIQSVDRIGKYSFKVTCISGVGLLDTKYHKGGLYTGQTLGTILSDIVGSSFSYTIANDVSSVLVFGHLPYDTARANLHRLLFSCGAVMQKNDHNTDYSIGWLSNTSISVPDSRIALGGSVGYQLPSNKVEITEHGFFQTPNDETVVLYDNTNSTAADNLTVIFKDAPAYDLAATGSLSVIESGVNHAVVSGVGVLSGKMYTHTRQFVTMTDGTGQERTRRVAENELITSVNSRNVARRVLAYYKSAKTIKAKIQLANEKCGQLLRMNDAFGDSTSGFLTRMEVMPTTIKAASCELIDGYIPGNQGNNYMNRIQFTASGTWRVPSGVASIRIVLVGGGQGGQGGCAGQRGAGDLDEGTWGHGDMSKINYDTPFFHDEYEMVGYGNDSQPLALGGASGSPGEPGKIAVYDVDVTANLQFTLSIGRGGSGGAARANGDEEAEEQSGYGSNGTPSTAVATGYNLSSEDGAVIDGYYDPLGNVTYGVLGAPGHNGGNGGQTDNVDLRAASGGKGLNGGSVGAYSGGQGGNGWKQDNSYVISGRTRDLHKHFSGGGGGGAAWGAIGGNGTAAYEDHREITPGYEVWGLYTGSGGAGANAVAPLKAQRGNGGDGGNGGGGGGNVGGYDTYGQDSTPHPTTILGQRGTAGQGSRGGDGGDGIIVIYY